MLFTLCPMNPVEKAIDILGSQANLARACRQRPQAITRWLREGRVPPKHAAAIESATDGAVTRHDLRPDIFGAAPSADPQQQVA
jgi:DNA-binding transcriptional regulator YdaS (Cro superfamily)